MCGSPSGVMVSDYGQYTHTRDVHQCYYVPQVTFEQYDHEITCLVMKVVGAYVSWIDITYIANEKFSRSVNYCDMLSNLLCYCSLLLKYLQVEALRESSCDCLTEIVSKGN